MFQLERASSGLYIRTDRYLVISLRLGSQLFTLLGIVVYSVHWFWCTIGIPIVYITGVLLYTVFTGFGVRLESQLFTLVGCCCIQCSLVLVYDWDPNCLHYWGIVVYSVHWFWCTIGIPIVYIIGVLLCTMF